MGTKQKTQRPAVSAGKSRPRRDAVNEVRLVGRLSAPPKVRLLPSGDEVVQLRLVVDRPEQKQPRAQEGRRPPTIDTIDVACWSTRSRDRGLACSGMEVIEVTGALRRRFWRVPGGVASRYEVEAHRIRVLTGSG